MGAIKRKKKTRRKKSPERRLPLLLLGFLLSTHDDDHNEDHSQNARDDSDDIGVVHLALSLSLSHKPCRLLRKDSTPGTRTTTKRAGRINKTIGKIILTAALAMAASMSKRRLTRSESEKMRPPTFQALHISTRRRPALQALRLNDARLPFQAYFAPCERVYFDLKSLAPPMVSGGFAGHRSHLDGRVRPAC